MSLRLNSPGWSVRRTRRGGGAAATEPSGLPDWMLSNDSRVAEEATLESVPPTRGQPVSGGTIDLSCDVEPGQVAILVVRQASNALTVHQPVQSVSRGFRGPSQVRFQVTIRRSTATRGLGSQIVKVIVVKAAQWVGDTIVSLLLPKLVAAFEQASWKKHNLKEGWLRITKESLAARTLESGKPVSPARSLLFLHGTFSNAASAFHALADSTFFERVKSIYDDRIFAFDHFSLSRTPEENARMLLESLPEQATTFDVVTHSRGGLVLRTLVELARQFGPLAKRFALGRAVLVASPNDGTPLATPDRWERTVGFLANILEIFPDNPFTTGAEFVANGLVWLANHASGDIPGLHAMDTEGDPIARLQDPPGPPPNAYSALVANYNPTQNLLHRMLDAGIDQFFRSANDLVVPSEGGWEVDRLDTVSIPGSQIGCYGPGGNLPGDSITHVHFFQHPETADFLVNALTGRQQLLNAVDPRKRLPDRMLLRGAPAPMLSAGAVVGRQYARPHPPVEAPLHVTVVNGDLSFEPAPLLLGHYASTLLTGTEAVMDQLVGGAMGRALKVGLYPLETGSHQIFLNHHTDPERGILIPRPEAVIVAGLGPEGKLQPGDLVTTVRLAVIGWSRRLTELRKGRSGSSSFELASTFIGSGGTISAGQAAELIVRGVQEGNELLLQDGGENLPPWPHCSHLRLIELYLNRATEGWNAIRMLEEFAPHRLKLAKTLDVRSGSMPRPADWGYRGADYDLITVQPRYAKGGECTFEYTLNTRRARSEVRGQRTQSNLLENLIAAASSEQNRDERIGRTLFNLVIPVELESYLASSGNMQMSLEETTAAIPWELLDVTQDNTIAEEPWAIRTKLLRKLRISQFREPEQVVDTSENDGILIIGEPQCPEWDYPRLEAAREEALAVHDCLTATCSLPDAQVKLLASESPAEPGPDASEVINSMFERRWRIVHISGHGALGSDDSPSGVVLSGGLRLSSSEIQSMRAVPQLVFINCCYLARLASKPNIKFDRARFASSVAGALIQIGVRCVVAAGWAVEDDAAKIFATEFYASLLRGSRFIDAVADGRRAAYERARGGNTWAAYQCYGDPNWRFNPNIPDPYQARQGVTHREHFASAVAVRLELDRIRVETEFQERDPITQVNRLLKLEKMLHPDWAKDGAVAEAFGAAYFAAGALENALRLYQRAIEATDGRASMRAAEQLSNARCRLAWENVNKAVRQRDLIEQQVAALKETKDSAEKTRAAATRVALRDAEKTLEDAVNAALPEIEKSLKMLDEIIVVKRTMERECLRGSAFKRNALINLSVERTEQARNGLEQMKQAYRLALEVGEEEGSDRLFYPASNCLAAALALEAKLDTDFLKKVEKYLGRKGGDDADFWSEAAKIELDEYECIARGQLSQHLHKLEMAFRNLYKRAKPRRMWASVYDNACLVLESYHQVKKGSDEQEATAAKTLLTLIGTFAHPDDLS